MATLTPILTYSNNNTSSSAIINDYNVLIKTFTLQVSNYINNKSNAYRYPLLVDTILGKSKFLNSNSCINDPYNRLLKTFILTATNPKYILAKAYRYPSIVDTILGKEKFEISYAYRVYPLTTILGTSKILYNTSLPFYSYRNFGNVIDNKISFWC